MSDKQSAEWQKFGTIGQFWLVFMETTSAEKGREGSWNQERRGWIAAQFGSKPPRGTSRIGRRAISFADCRYRQPLPKYLIPKRLELSMDYKPIYYFSVPTHVSRGSSHEYDAPSSPIESFGRNFEKAYLFLRQIVESSAIGKHDDFICTKYKSWRKGFLIFHIRT